MVITPTTRLLVHVHHFCAFENDSMKARTDPDDDYNLVLIYF